MDRRQRTVALLVAGTLFMEILDGTIIAPAAPSMAKALAVTPERIGLAITAYLVSMAVFIPLNDWCAVRWGMARLFRAAIVAFTLSSVGCALATSLGILVGLRVVQGAAGAMMVPVGRLAVLQGTDKVDLVRAVAYLTWPALLAPVLAPALGGAFATYWSWRWIFVVNVPLGVIAYVAARKILPPELPKPRPPRFDVLGWVMTAGVTMSAVLLSSMLQTTPIRWWLVATVALAGAALLAALVAYLRRAEHGVLRLQSLAVPTFRLAISSGSLFRLSINTLPFLLPLLFQEAFGWTAFRAGLMVLWVFVGNVAIKPLTTPMLRRFGFRAVILAATTGSVLTIFGCVFLSAATPAAALATLLLVSGISRSIAFTAYNTIAFADIEPDQLSSANTLSATVQQVAIGMSAAVAALALVAARGLGPHRSVTSDFHGAFIVLAILTIPAIVGVLRMPAAMGEGIRPTARRR